MPLSPLQPSTPLPRYRLTVRGERGRFLDVELALDDGLLAVDLVLTRDAVQQMSARLPATIVEAGVGGPARRAVAEDVDDDETNGEDALVAQGRNLR